MNLQREIENSAPFAIRMLWACLTVGPTLWVFLSPLTLSGMTSAEAAAWVQAVGSVGAIIVACAVASWQAHKAHKNRALEHEGRLSAMFAVIENAANYALSVEQLVEQGPADFVFRSAWTIAIGGPVAASTQALGAIPLHELGDARLVVQCVTMIGAMNKLKSEAEAYLSQTPSMELTTRTYTSIKIQAQTVGYAWSEFRKAGADRISSPGPC